MPMPAMTTRSLGGGRPSLPSAEAGMTQGKATRAAEALSKVRRLTAEWVGFWFELFMVLAFLVHFFQGRFCFVAKVIIGGLFSHPLQSFFRDGRLPANQRFGDFFVSRKGLALQ